MPELTDERLAEIRDWHSTIHLHCATCRRKDAECDTALLLVEVDRLRAERDEMRATVERIIVCTTSPARAEGRRMVADGQGRAFSAAIHAALRALGPIDTLSDPERSRMDERVRASSAGREDGA